MSAIKTVYIQDIGIGEGQPLAFMAGPCVIESRDHAMRMAEQLKELFSDRGAPLIFKSSYDKANRSSIDSYRGPGLEAGAKILGEIRETFELPILTDVHEPYQVEVIAEVADILQVPAFLSRQTDLILAIAESGRVVNVKKGQFLAPWDIKQVIEKVERAGNERILITERGVSFGYNNLVSDMRAFPMMKKLGYPVVMDATHSAQLPGGLGDATGGQREFIPHVSRAAVAAGANAIFMEIHDDVEQAKSDAATQWRLNKTGALVRQLQQVHKLVNEMEEL